MFNQVDNKGKTEQSFYIFFVLCTVNVKIRQNYIIFTNKTIGNGAVDEPEIVCSWFTYCL